MKGANQRDDRKAKGHTKAECQQEERDSGCVVLDLYKVLGGCEIIGQLRE